MGSLGDENHYVRGTIHYLDLHWGISGYLHRRIATPIINARVPSRRGSDPGSEPDDATCQARVLYMDLPRKLTAMSQKPRGDPVCELAELLVRGRDASRLPSSDLSRGIPMRRAHRLI